MIERIAIFWNERKKTKLGQLHLLWIVSFIFCTVAAIRASDLSTRQKLAFALGGSALIYAGLIICYFVPTHYLAYIRRRKEVKDTVLIHRVLFVLYIFPFIPFVFMAVTALVMSTGLFDR
jgi:hypothetical protein